MNQLKATLILYIYKNRKEPKKYQEPSKLEPNRTGTENGTETGTGTTLAQSRSPAKCSTTTCWTSRSTASWSKYTVSGRTHPGTMSSASPRQQLSDSRTFYFPGVYCIWGYVMTIMAMTASSMGNANEAQAFWTSVFDSEMLKLKRSTNMINW